MRQNSPRSSLRNMPTWLNMASWIVVACSLALASLIMIMNFQSARKESDISATIYLERGSSLIYAYEATLRAGLGFQWSDDELQQVMDGLATSPDIYFMAVTNKQGLILAASDPALLNKHLPSINLSDDLEPQAQIRGMAHDFAAEPDGVFPNHTFLVYKTVEDRQNADRLMQHHAMRSMRWGGHRNSVNMPMGPRARAELIVFVAYDMTSLLDAQAADERRVVVYGVVLGFLALVGALSLFLIKSYQKSRRVVQETTAFSFAIIDNLPLGLIAVNDEGRITAFNPEAARMTGLSESSASRALLAEILPELWRVLVSRDLLSTRNVHQEELRCMFATTRRIPLALTVAPIIIEEERQAGHTLIMRDLGEIRKLEAELRRQDRLAALGSMAAGVAHEIRNPLGAIKGLARFFADSSPAGSEEAKIADIMTREVLRLDKVVGELLDLSRQDALRLAPVDLHALMERLRGMIEGELASRSIKFRLEIPYKIPEPIMDGDRMTQVFLNLFLNAVQAMPDGGVLTVRVLIPESTDLTEEGVNVPMLRFEVEDTGEGILPENLSAVFSPYFTTKAKGTGLGLSLVHKIVEAHDGLVEVVSEPGKGACFSVSLPLILALPASKPGDGKAHA